MINVVQLTLGSGRDCGKLEGLCSFQREHLFLSPTVLFSCGNGAQRVQNYNSLKEVRKKKKKKSGNQVFVQNFLIF